MDESDSSALSSPPSSDDEIVEHAPKDRGLKSSKIIPMMKIPSGDVCESAHSKKRPASPPHIEVLEDNADIAFIVMFRSRFASAFPSKLAHFGPQDIERGIVDPLPSPPVENLLCALLGLVLNRKKCIERGHYGRALEEAIQTQKHQWPQEWNGSNPLCGGRSFTTMNPKERLTLLKNLIFWSLHSSDAISAIIKDSYKQTRRDDDLNQPLSVQPWGRDSSKRRYWLIEGQDDTQFRLYRESVAQGKGNTWWAIAGSIEELQGVAQKLREDGTQASRRLSEKINNAIPRFEATDEKRKRREYRLTRKTQFSRPDPGFSLYECRTRGKRMKYTFSDEDDDTFASDDTSLRRSVRQSGQATPAEIPKPTVTASGRQVRSRIGGMYGETVLRSHSTDRASPMNAEYPRSDSSEEPCGRETRSGNSKMASNGRFRERKRVERDNFVAEMDEDSTSGNDWEGDDDEEEMDQASDTEDEDDLMEYEDELKDEPMSLIVSLKYRKSVDFSTRDSVAKDESKCETMTGEMRSCPSVGANTLMGRSSDSRNQVQPNNSKIYHGHASVDSSANSGENSNGQSEINNQMQLPLIHAQKPAHQPNRPTCVNDVSDLGNKASFVPPIRGSPADGKASMLANTLPRAATVADSARDIRLEITE